MNGNRFQADVTESSSKNDMPLDASVHQGRRPKLWLQLLLLLWVEAVIAAYFWVHKPWPISQLPAPLSALLDVTLALALAALAGGLGRFILRSWRGCSPLEMVAFQLALGMGVLSVGVLVVGWMGWLGTRLALILLALGLIGFRNHIREWLRGWSGIVDGFGASDRLERFARWLSFWLIGLNGIQALAPPLKWDSLVYHLELPRRYIEAGSIHYLSDNLFNGQPQLAEMMYTWAMALRSGSTAAVLGWTVGVTAIMGVAGFSGRLLGNRSKWMAAAILLSGASISRSLSWAYVDLWVLLFGLAVTVILVQPDERKPLRRVVLAGVFSGFAISTKYSAAILLPIGAVLLMIEWLGVVSFKGVPLSRSAEDSRGRLSRTTGSGREVTKIISYPAAFGLAALLTASPWVLKNYFMTGNPIYPYFFEARDVDALRQLFYAGDAPQRNVLDSLLIPFKATIYGIEGGPSFNTSISVLPLALLPFLLVGWRSLTKELRNTLAKLGLIALVAWMIWGAGSHAAIALNRSRHYYAAFPALTVLACAGYLIGVRLESARVRTGWILKGLVLFVLILSGVGETLTFAGTNPLRVIAGVDSEGQYLADQLGWYGPTMDAINRLPPESRVYFLWEPRAYYCRVECSPDVILDRWWHLNRTVGDAQRIAASIRAAGFTHVLIYDLGVELERVSRQVFTPSDWDELEKLRTDELILVSSFGDTYTLYAASAMNSGKDNLSMTRKEDDMSHE